jgi:hypothetical protein
MDVSALIAQAQANPPVMFLAGVLLAALLITLLNVLKASLGGGKSSGGKVFLDATKFQPLPLTKVDRISHNTLRLRFDLPDPQMRLGLPIGQHITFLARDNEGKDVYRPYTPVTDDDTRGSVEFVIKVYPQGKMSQVVGAMKMGDTMQMKGPRGRFAYKRNQWREIGEGEERSRGAGREDDGVPGRNEKKLTPPKPTPTTPPPTKQACSPVAQASPRCTKLQWLCSKTPKTAPSCRSCTAP